jgi:hypothetical protein
MTHADSIKKEFLSTSKLCHLTLEFSVRNSSSGFLYSLSLLFLSSHSQLIASPSQSSWGKCWDLPTGPGSHCYSQPSFLTLQRGQRGFLLLR